MPLKGDPWKAIIMGELLANFHFGKVYLGVGPGLYHQGTEQPLQPQERR